MQLAGQILAADFLSTVDACRCGKGAASYSFALLPACCGQSKRVVPAAWLAALS